MQEAMTYYLRTACSYTKFGERATPRTGNGELPTMTLYPCLGGGANDYVYVMAVTPRMWEAMCKIMGREDLLTDPRFEHQADRFENRDALRDEISAWTMARDKYAAMRELADGGVPASAILDTKDLYTNPHLVERGFIKTVQHEVHGEIKLLGWPARLSESEVPIKGSPRLGAHSREVVQEDLSLGDAELDALLSAQVISQAAPIG